MALKLKVKVTAKDLALFGLFCVILLYLCFVVVVNVLTIINLSEFAGLFPFKYFDIKHIPVILVLFFGVLAVIFFSVSSTIFEFAKGGPGLKIGERDSDGYSRWMEEKEMKKLPKVIKVGVTDEHAEHGGVVLINDGKNMWIDNSENHTLVVGVSGSGKTTAIIDPLVYSLAKARESMILTDPKGEIHRNHASYLKHMGYNIVVVNFRSPMNGNAWNPLMIPYNLYKSGNKDKASELVDDIASNICKDANVQDPFWQDSSADYLSACILGLFEDAKPEEINLKSINYITSIGEDKFGGNSTYIKEYFKFKGEESPTYVLANNTINAPQETKGGILSTFRGKIRPFGSRDTLSDMLSYSDFDMSKIGQEPTAVFIVVQDEKKTYHGLATIFIKQVYESLIDVAQSSPGSHLPIRVNFLLDEFANMPALKDITTMVTAARSRWIRFTFIIQNYSQLDKVYGKEEAETIKSNCSNKFYLLTTELAALEEISKLCGEVKSKKEDKTASVPLITVADLQKLKPNEVIILRDRENPFRTHIKPAWQVDWGDKEFNQPAEFPLREEREVALFDLKNFVDVRKRSDMKKGGESSPFGGGLGGPGGISDPFANSSRPSGGLPSFADIMSGGMSGLNSSSNSNPNRIPTFEEFVAARNANKPTMNTKPKVDIDDLVKKIDAQIAKLEEEERQEKLKQEKVTTEKPNNFNPFEENKVVFDNPVQTPAFEEKKEEVVQPTSNTQTFNDLFSNMNNQVQTEVPVQPNVPAQPVEPIQIQESLPVQVQETVPVQQVVFEEPTKPVEQVSQGNLFTQPGGMVSTPNNFFDNMIKENVEQVPVQPQQQVQPQVMVQEQPQTIQFVNPEPVVQEQPVQTTPVQPQPAVENQTVKVDTQTQVVESNTDDEYFDDFFE
ncbi:MAG: type IV secretory system conjugative DNA transfer family protein [Bacilli bacterium]|nr:type IV secretory system conjugative DNA transfer family protein [Bacilli bacterium]